MRVKVMVATLQDLDTVRGTVMVRIGVWASWTDPRLVGRSRLDPQPTHLWSPRLSMAESLDGFSVRNTEFTIWISSMQGETYSLTWYEGKLKEKHLPFKVVTLFEIW